MKRSRFSEEQIIAILREHEAGAKTTDVCRKHGISGATFYKWKAKYGGLEVSDAKRLKGLEDENRRLKGAAMPVLCANWGANSPSGAGGFCAGRRGTSAAPPGTAAARQAHRS